MLEDKPSSSPLTTKNSIQTDIRLNPTPAPKSLSYDTAKYDYAGPTPRLVEGIQKLLIN
jgi:hypothetical protein